MGGITNCVRDEKYGSEKGKSTVCDILKIAVFARAAVSSCREMNGVGEPVNVCILR